MVEMLQDLQRMFKIDYSQIFTEFIRWIPNLIVGILVFFFFWVLFRLLRYLIIRGLKKTHLSITIIDLLIRSLKYFMFTVAFLMMANQWGIQILPLLSTFGVAGIAIGLAAQQTIGNIISGITILVSRPFKEGDWIELDGVFGKVIQITLRSTHLLTTDNLLVDYPNQKLLESKIINHTFNEHIRLRIQVGIAYKESISAAQEVILGVINDDVRFLTKPEPRVVVTEIADSSINLELQVWLNDATDEILLSYELRKKVKLALDAANIEIPFPHHQVFIENIQAKGIEQLFRK
ncbi:mechanosensitive ion channel family protein [candidate division KSB1 bacterium]|nr:mechanosensitive ion channel family protein [candidate division KSB1 bacterium]